jgi:hypothetical protein
VGGRGRGGGRGNNGGQGNGKHNPKSDRPWEKYLKKVTCTAAQLSAAIAEKSDSDESESSDKAICMSNNSTLTHLPDQETEEGLTTRASQALPDCAATMERESQSELDSRS